jgi:hypothetical protein
MIKPKKFRDVDGKFAKRSEAVKDIIRTITIGLVIAVAVIGIIKTVVVINKVEEVEIIEDQDSKNIKVSARKVLSEEEQAQVKLAQELIQKEAEQLKIKSQLTEERAKLLAEYDAKLKAVETELSAIRGSKLSFQFRPRQDESQRQSTKQNAGPVVSVLTKDSAERLGIISSSQQHGEPTH